MLVADPDAPIVSRARVIGADAPVVTTSADPATRLGSVDPNLVVAALPGRVISIYVAAGESVPAGADLLLLETMKMHVTVRAPFDAVVRHVHCSPRDVVARGAPLLELARAAIAAPVVEGKSR